MLDQADAADLMDLIRGELGLGQRERRFPRKDTLAAIYSRMVNAGAARRGPGARLPVVRRRRRRHPRRLRAPTPTASARSNVLDYDDLLLFWRAARRLAAAGRRSRALFDHVLVDEYQDTNALQADILLALRAGRPRT